ncbi:helix-turn-helix domain-containing protein, partial [Micrococcus luteus]|uniref:helix-turn-helix domain-containing protein n=1 Tax=Micrococcus luteus TaxID=1270 RepID=UPI00301680DE
MATSGKKHWPPMGRTQWPLTDGIPQAHVAAEFRVSRPTVATWVARYRAQGEAGLQDL